MSYRVYRKDNYIFIEDLSTKVEIHGRMSSVEFYRQTTSSKTFFIKGFSDTLPLGLTIPNILDEHGVPYTTFSFIKWYSANTASQPENQGNSSLTSWGEILGTLSNQTDLQAELDALVPYSGATSNVDLGEFQLRAGQLELDQTPTGTAGVGKFRWNDTDGTADLGLKGGNVTLQLGQEQLARVVNKTSPLVDLLEANYQAVMITGATGQRLSVKLAKGDSDANSAGTLGIVTETILKNQEGFITTSGSVREINTTGSLQGETWADGDILYLSPTTFGGITNVKPTAPYHTVVLGYVEYAHNTHGKIWVKVDNGYELEELHNVSDTSYSSTIDTDSLLIFDITSSLWKKFSWANVKSKLKTYFDTLYQTILVSGTSIKTVNSTSLLGSGDINVSTKYGSKTTSEISSLVGMVAGDTVWNSTRLRTEVYNGTYWAGERQDVYLLHGSVTMIVSQTIAFGVLPVAPIQASIAGNPYRWVCRGAKIIRGAEFNCYAGGTAGSNQAWSLYIRVNGTTDYLVATISSVGPERIFSNQSLNIPLVDGDHVRMVFVNPAWVTPPTGVATGGYLRIE